MILFIPTRKLNLNDYPRWFAYAFIVLYLALFAFMAFSAVYILSGN